MQNWITILAFAFFLWAEASFAIEPKSCIPTPIKIDNKNIILSGSPPKKPQIYFFTNQSQTSIFIDHPTLNPGASAGWSSYLRPGNWAALVLNKKDFAIQCATIQPGKVIPLNCSETILVCSPEHWTVSTKLKGNYWLAEDKDWETLIKILSKKGINITSTLPPPL